MTVKNDQKQPSTSKRGGKGKAVKTAQPQVPQLDQEQLKTLHRSAMEWVDKADDARRRGQPEKELKALQEALKREEQAAGMLYFMVDVEPTRSVL